MGHYVLIIAKRLNKWERKYQYKFFERVWNRLQWLKNNFSTIVLNHWDQAEHVMSLKPQVAMMLKNKYLAG